MTHAETLVGKFVIRAPREELWVCEGLAREYEGHIQIHLAAWPETNAIMPAHKFSLAPPELIAAYIAERMSA